MNNDYEIRGKVTAIFLNHKGNRIETIINTSDLEKVKEYPNAWYAKYDRTIDNYYVVSKIPENGKRKLVTLHRYILEGVEGYQVDHINHNPLDNRKENLAIVTKYENTQNRRLRKDNKSGFTNVYWRGNEKKWAAQITAYGKTTTKYFKDKHEAAKWVEENKVFVMPYLTIIGNES